MFPCSNKKLVETSATLVVTGALLVVTRSNYILILIASCYYYTGQKKVALLDVETHDNPIPLESYTMTQGKMWAVICHPGKLFITINLKECDN